MPILRWIGVNPQASTSTQHTKPTLHPHPDAKSDDAIQRAPSADAKRFGLVNSGNTCYANSVLQALYFCDPFRDLIINSPDRSFLYPSEPISSATSAQASPAAKQPAKPETKPTAAVHKRPISGSHPSADPRPDASAKADADEAANAQDLGPPIPASPPSLFSALRSLFIHISQHPHDKGTVNPNAFITKLRKENELFRTTMHQDAHEFLNYLINRVVEDIEEEDTLLRKRENAAIVKEKGATLSPLATEDLSTSITTSATSQTHSSSSLSRKTFIHDLFEGTLTSETRCLTCETVSPRDEPFLDLSIDIEQNSSVTACLRQFSASEMLCQRNKFFCDSCCGLQEAEKRMKIKRLPNVLALHLKRFKYQEELQKYVKLSYRVAFPFELRLFNTVDDAADMDRLYELWAIVVHIGGGPLHGHYITIIKSQGSWQVFDDESVETIRESDIPKYFGEGGSGTGYVLFYQATDLNREALGLPPLPVASMPMHEQIKLKAQAGPPSPAVPISIEPSSPSVVTSGADTTLVSSPPSPSPALTRLDIPSQSPATSTQPLPSPGPVSTAASSIQSPGGFFSSLRHSKSLKADKIALVAALNPPVPVHPRSATAATDANHQKETHREEKSSGGGWLSFRLRVPPRPLPKIPSTPIQPPSPMVTTAPVRRPSTAGTGTMEHIPSLPSAVLPLPATPSQLHPKSGGGGGGGGGESREYRFALGFVELDFWCCCQWGRYPACAKGDATPTTGPDCRSAYSEHHEYGPDRGTTAYFACSCCRWSFELVTESPVPSTWSIPGSATLEGIPALDKGPAQLSAVNPSADGHESARGSSSSVATQSQAPPTASSHVPSGPGPSHHQQLPVRGTRQSTKEMKEARKAAEAVAKRNKELAEEERRKLKYERERARVERERAEKERERAEKKKREEEHEQQKVAKRTSRKMSLGLGGLGGLVGGWSRDKDKDKEKTHATSSIPHSLRTGTSTAHANGNVVKAGVEDANSSRVASIDQDTLQRGLRPEGHYVSAFNF
ncbi:Probable ubiquitin carboxyl-terminal hydrolase creB; AltName: Full=Carbon catabolite repression protein B; AltName: Full=Deubiquitinating enzyme creB; AltName: Full=Ubiquitin thioesterase creB; AltName: Full=Ubiquitin-hydrolyzing enzyme creB; AltName: Full=Ubiquitin-specific-processing protease creB [Serendipita indica DSM 11827]|nr:Probable ubiquitin carboxyl-terminal hydrolase creB; AltName: Full=Carbon catabolite repression protein B; AltName: Full=Deubiquitinating enzyme creB; AltName: Full=Ubiquitin thioesterase creB; AltName: Full=Ubiquitin-hydrolyzing enzyme creB; AltName: Full=Ubiquitin-specific-processing protease creB [Serendipita indica DSM 11827]